MLMSTTTIRISRKTRDTLQELAQRSGVSMQTILEEAVELYQGEQLLEATNAAYAALKEDPDAWNALQEERAEWDITLGDGLEGL